MTKTYEVIGAAGANLRKNPSSGYPREPAAHLNRGEQVQVITDWSAVNTVGSSTTYLPVLYKGDVLYCSKAVLGPCNLAALGDDGRIYLRGYSTLPLKQSGRPDGPWKEQLAKHGCGACSLRIALNLSGKCALTPEHVMDRAKQLFGSKLSGESYGLSALGMVTIAESYGVKAEALPVTAATRLERGAEIDAALKACKRVCCWCKSEPFSRSTHHWVVAVGYDADGKVMIANSGGPDRVQRVTLNTLVNGLYAGGKLTANEWLRSANGSAGVVIVG